MSTLTPQVSTDSKLAGASSENATVLQCRASQLGIVTGQPPEPKKLKSWTVSLLFDVLQNWNCFSALNFKTPFLGSFRQQAGRREPKAANQRQAAPQQQQQIMRAAPVKTRGTPTSSFSRLLFFAIASKLHGRGSHCGVQVGTCICCIALASSTPSESQSKLHATPKANS